MSLEKHPTRFGLIRHAPTVWNREKRIQGQLDSPLTTEGESHCKTWGKILSSQPWDRIVSSDLGRASRTAELINTVLNVPMTHTPLLREVDWGEWTGRSIKQIKAENPGVLPEMEKAGWAFRPPGGEDRIAVWERAQRALMDAAEKWPQQSILVVTHEGVIKCLVYRLSQRRFLPDEPSLLTSGYLHRVIYGKSGLQIEKINALALVGQGVRRQKTEDRRQEIEDRRQKTEDRRQEIEGRRQEIEGRRQKTEDSGQISEDGD